jgi:hypothetical protein
MLRRSSSLPENSVIQPLAFSGAATEASVEEDSAVSVDFRDSEGVDWSRLKGFVTPLSTPQGKASWIFQHSWRVWKEGTHDPDESYFVCKYCHTHKLLRKEGLARHAQRSISRRLHEHQYIYASDK